jgi:hypothetical protein
MPKLEEHCQHSLKRFKVEGREIHSWLDEPSRVYGGIHREFRHDEQTIILVGKLFGDKFGVDIAQAIALDHIMADHEEAIKKRNGKNASQLEEVNTYEKEKPKYENKRKELAKSLSKNELPEISIREIKDYLDANFTETPTEKLARKRLAESALKNWQFYLLSRGSTGEIKTRDITRFISSLRNRDVSASTISNYLGQLFAYFKHENEQELADFANKQKKEFQAMVSKKYMPMRFRDLKTLYNNSELEDKLLLRLLLLETIPLNKLPKIQVVKESDGKYYFNDGKQVITINKETVKIAEPLIEKNRSKNSKRLLSYKSYRTINERIQRLAEAVNAEYKIYAKNLRKFGSYVHKDDLLEWLSSQ